MLRKAISSSGAYVARIVAYGLHAAGMGPGGLNVPRWSSNKSRVISPRKAIITSAMLTLVLLTFALSSWRLHDAQWLEEKVWTHFPSKGKGETTIPRFWSSTTRDMGLQGITDYKAPKGMPIVGLVFYGRPASVSILDCYIKRNLKQNGGLLDHVIFIARTDIEDDLVWLDALVNTTTSYSRHNVSSFEAGDFRTAWNIAQNGTMYIKMDDDIVFFEDSTIPSLVEMKVNHPEYFMISANIINQPALSWVHYSLGAVLPYLPELEPPPTFEYYNFSTNNITRLVEAGNDTDLSDFSLYSPVRNDNWRPSELPSWSGPADYKLDIDTFTAPYKGHRWLPVDTSNISDWNATTMLDDTPIFHTNFDAFGPALSHWEIGAQQHYSFLSHLEANTLYRYKFHTWDYRYARMGIQFMAIMGDDVWKSMPMHRDDEHWLSEEMPQRTRRHGVVDGRAIAAHYSFGPQRKGMDTTDLLDRYRAFAKENICLQRDDTLS